MVNSPLGMVIAREGNVGPARLVEMRRVLPHHRPPRRTDNGEEPARAHLDISASDRKADMQIGYRLPEVLRTLVIAAPIAVDLVSPYSRVGSRRDALS